MTAWQVGMHAHCVRVERLWDEFSWMTMPEVGCVYTIRRVAECTLSGRCALYLEEIHNADDVVPVLEFEGRVHDDLGEPGFNADWFRPLSASRLNTLLLAIRTSARSAMPGLSDSVLDVGLNSRTVERLARELEPA